VTAALSLLDAASIAMASAGIGLFIFGFIAELRRERRLRDVEQRRAVRSPYGERPMRFRHRTELDHVNAPAPSPRPGARAKG
jgi:hypothetical protein